MTEVDSRACRSVPAGPRVLCLRVYFGPRPRSRGLVVPHPPRRPRQLPRGFRLHQGLRVSRPRGSLILYFLVAVSGSRGLRRAAGLGVSGGGSGSPPRPASRARSVSAGRAARRRGGRGLLPGDQCFASANWVFGPQPERGGLGTGAGRGSGRRRGSGWPGPDAGRGLGPQLPAGGQDTRSAYWGSFGETRGTGGLGLGTRKRIRGLFSRNVGKGLGKTEIVGKGWGSHGRRLEGRG